MSQNTGGQLQSDKGRQTAAEIARNRVLAAYASRAQKTSDSRAARDLGRSARRLFNNSYGQTNTPATSSLGTYKQTPIATNVARQSTNNEEWKKYHSAWQNYYQKYYSDYYSKAAKTYLENEKLKSKREAEDHKRNGDIIENPQAAVNPTEEEEQSILSDLRKTIKKHAKIEASKTKRHRRLIPIIAGILVVLLILFLQYNRLIFAPIMAYVSPGNSEDNGISALDPTITTAVGPDNRLIIPKLNVDVPVNFGIANDTATINTAMENGVAQFSIPGANAMPGEIGNLVITGHSAGDIYSNNQYKFIFSGLERLGANDLIYLDYQGVRYTYSVVRMETVEPTDVNSLILNTDKPMLTLVTCTPLGTSRYRLLVISEQINPTPSGATQQENVDNGNENSNESETMPQNSPTFFERIWNWLTGQG